MSHETTLFPIRSPISKDMPEAQYMTFPDVIVAVFQVNWRSVLEERANSEKNR